ncbi:hypothetical protein GCM10010403_49410 [Glycomyces rutgersensis]
MRIVKSKYLQDLVIVGAQSDTGPVLSIDALYVDVKLQEPRRGAQKQKFYGRFEDRRGKRSSLIDFLGGGDANVFAIYGMLGAGKSTLLRATALKLAKAHSPWAPIPILIVLAHHTKDIVADEHISLIDVVSNSRWLDADYIPREQIQRWLRKRRCAIMLDGLDEVRAEHRPIVLTWAENLHGRYPRSDLVVTSREAGFESARLDVRKIVLEVCPLTPDQIRAFVTKWYEALGKSGEMRMSEAKLEGTRLLGSILGTPALLELASTPLLLHLIVLVHHYGQHGLPADRDELYEELMGMLLHERRKHTKGVGPVSGLELKPKRLIAQRLALKLMLDRLVDFDPASVLEQVIEGTGLDVTVEELVNDLRENGLLSKIDSDTYAFAHLSFQEYLAAQEICATGTTDLLIERIGDSWWKETARFAAMQGDADPLIDAALKLRSSDGWALAIRLEHDSAARERPVRADLAARIEAFLAKEHPVDSVEHFIVCTELIRRNLERIRVEGDDLIVCAEPVKGELFRLYRRVQEQRGLHFSRHAVDANGIVRGLWPVEVEEFLGWLNRFEQNGLGYRLPRQVEAAKYPLQRSPSIEAHGLWTDEGGAKPFNPLRAGSQGFSVSRGTISDQMKADWDFMIGGFDLSGRPGTDFAVQQIRDGFAALQQAVQSATATVRDLESGQQGTDPAASAATNRRREYTDHLSKRTKELESLVDQRTIMLLDVIAVLKEIRPAPRPDPYAQHDPIYIAAVEDQIEAFKNTVTAAFTESFNWYRSRYRARDAESDLTARAGAVLLSPRLPTRMLNPGSLRAHPHYLHDALLDAQMPTRVLPGEVLPRLGEVRQLFDTPMRTGRRPAAPPSLIQDQLNLVQQALTPMLDRRSPLDLGTIATARITLYAAAMVSSGSQAAGNPDPLWSCIAGLTAIEARQTGKSPADEAIALIRFPLSS